MDTTPPMPAVRRFAFIFVLGRPGAGKGTLCTHLARTHKLAHYSIGDGLRKWMRENRTTSFAAQIQDKLDNQGFLTFSDLAPFILAAVEDALSQDEPRPQGILLDGFPRCVGQLESFMASRIVDVVQSTRTHARTEIVEPGNIVLCFGVNKENSKARYIARARDSNDSEEKFERRFAEYEKETMPVEEVFRQRGIMIDVDANGTKEENVKTLTRTLEGNTLWQKNIAQVRK